MSESKRKKLQTTPAAAVVDPEEVEQKCGHFVKRKKRFCKMTVAKGKSYCGEHEPAIIVDSLEAHDKDDASRIPCPLDPKHTVYKWKLKKHLRICNARQRDDLPAYVVLGINSGESTQEETSKDFSKVKISDIDDTEFDRIVENVTLLYERYVQGKIEDFQSTHPALDDELAKSEYGNASRKHLIQTSSLLGILERKQQLCDDTSFIEFGAGKGQLSFHLAQILQEKNNSQVILLDRMSLRHKKDNKIEDKSLVHRIRVDIADFRMSQLELLHKSKRLVAVSKHLCGAATDLALRCIVQQQKECTENTEVTMPQTEGVLIALCCHHRCEWVSFVGKEFFIANGLGPFEFAIITKMVSWAICGTGISRERRKALEEQAHMVPPAELDAAATTTQKLSVKEREKVGFMCKRVLDYSRLEYLKNYHYDAALKYYVTNNVTLENVCLLAMRNKLS